MSTKNPSGSVLVTGATGFLGSHIAQVFENSGREVFRIDRQSSTSGALVMDLESVDFKSVLKTEQPDLIIHAAGGASVPFSMQNPNVDFLAGPALLASVLESVRVTSPKSRVIFLSSAAIYGNPAKLPIVESDEVHPISAYGFHKRMSELLCQEYSQLYGVQTACARIFSAYGSGLRKQVLWDLSSRLSAQPEKLSLKGSGTETRDFVHAKDVADAIFLIAEKGRFNADIYNVASGNETAIRTLSELLINAFGEKTQLAFDGISSQGDPQNWRADISKLSALGFSPKVNFENGVNDYVSWFNANAPR
ncbi:MAG: NAD-dependent epimerase/dehydratase family protein [Chthoniobacterales bacterium]